jgi:hypothetical protein
VATLYESAHDGAHKADDDLSASWQGSETLIESSYEFSRRRELDGGAICRGGSRHYERGLSIIRHGGNDALKFSDLLGWGGLRIGHTARSDLQLQGHSMCTLRLSYFKSKYLWFVRLRRASGDPGKYISTSTNNLLAQRSH